MPHLTRTEKIELIQIKRMTREEILMEINDVFKKKGCNIKKMRILLDRLENF